jgi:acyl carrier protein
LHPLLPVETTTRIEGVLMDVFGQIRESLTEIMDIEAEEVTPETYLVRDLGAESIDLLELSVALNSRFKIDINDDAVFLRTLRVCLDGARADGHGTVSHVKGKFPFLGRERVEEILRDLDSGPVLKVRDLVDYVSWQLTKS